MTASDTAPRHYRIPATEMPSLIITQFATEASHDALHDHASSPAVPAPTEPSAGRIHLHAGTQVPGSSHAASSGALTARQPGVPAGGMFRAHRAWPTPAGRITKIQ
jgi:hypothetical protein